MPPLPPEDLQHILDHTRELWEELRDRRIFITGGTGFFGMWLLESFAHANAQLALNAAAVVLSRNPDAFRQKAPHLFGNASIQLVSGDVRTFAFPDGEFSHVIHAGTTSSAPVPPLEMFDTITNGTRRVLDFTVACRAKKFLFISSGAVYGRQPPEITHVPETYPGAPDPADPNSAYGEGKRAAELLCAIYAQQHGIETKIARCFAFVGPHLPLDAHFAIGNFIRDAVHGGPIQVNGDGTPFRSYLYAADLAIWLWTILFKGEACRPYNVGSDEAISIADLARSVVQAIAPAAQISIASRPQPLNPSTPQPLPLRYVPDTHRAQRDLNLRAWTSLRAAIEKTVRWHSADRQAILPR
jgi:dTDP-glucose 4,6-dehydratase